MTFWRGATGRGYYNPGQYYTVTADVTFTAIWRPRTQAQKFSLSFGPGDGEGITGNPPASAEYEAYEEIILPANPFTRAGQVRRLVRRRGEQGISGARAPTPQRQGRQSCGKVGDYKLRHNLLQHFGYRKHRRLSRHIYHQYPDIQPSRAQRLGYSFEGWYADPDYTTPAVTTITAGSTGEKGILRPLEQDRAHKAA